nr:M24 family metallopeptidase [uncultured Oscillibacter sp.]
MRGEEKLPGVRHAQRLAERALSGLEGRLRPGMAEWQAAAELRALCMELPGVEQALTDMVISGPNSAGYHNFATDRVIGAGELILIDFSIVVHGWYSDMTRMYSLGEPEPEARRICDVVAAAKERAVAAAYPGVAASCLHRAAADLIQEQGYGPYFPHGLGHGIGREMHEVPRLNGQSQALLTQGTVFSIEPGIYLPGRFGARLEDLYYMSEEGIVCLNTEPAVLKILPV